MTGRGRADVAGSSNRAAGGIAKVNLDPVEVDS